MKIYLLRLDLHYLMKVFYGFFTASIYNYLEKARQLSPFDAKPIIING